MFNLKYMASALAIFIAIPTAAYAVDSPSKSLIETSASTFQVTALKDNHMVAFATGWVVTQQNGVPVVVTSTALMQDADHFSIIAQGSEKSATVLFRDHGLLFLSVPGLVSPALKLASRAPEQGDEVFAGTLNGIKAGHVSGSFSEGGDSGGEIDFNIGLMPGSAGAPLLDQNGEVLGVALGNHQVTDAEGSRDEDYAVSVSEVIHAVKAAGLQISDNEDCCPVDFGVSA